MIEKKPKNTELDEILGVYNPLTPEQLEIAKGGGCPFTEEHSNCPVGGHPDCEIGKYCQRNGIVLRKWANNLMKY